MDDQKVVQYLLDKCETSVYLANEIGDHLDLEIAEDFVDLQEFIFGKLCDWAEGIK